MKITNVVLEEDIEDTSSIVVATIVFDYGFSVNNIKVKTGLKGPYLIFPKKDSRPVAYPIKEETRKYILDEILKRLGEKIY